MTTKFNYTGNEFAPTVNVFIQKNDNTLSGYVGNYRNMHHRNSQDSLCKVGATFVKFRLTVEAGAIDISCSEHTPLAISAVLTEAVQSSSRYWSVDQKDNSHYILPVYYSYILGCKKGEVVNGDLTQNYSLFKFEDGTYIEEKNCVILRSLKFSTGVNENWRMPPPKH